MDFIEQIKHRQRQIGITLSDIPRIAAMATSNLCAILNGRKDIRASTLRTLAEATNAKWVLVPKPLIPQVEQLILKKNPASGPESAAQRAPMESDDE
jgi:transcriptional regulator with XRE-family HTH domain